MAWAKDITGTDKPKKGPFRSLNGAADENIFIGRASKAGLFCFFKVWRDMPYDAVIDYGEKLYRVEVKGSSGRTFNVTRGSRSGAQIKKDPTLSRTRTLSRHDCDFVVGVDSNNGDCYVIPEDIIEILNRTSLGIAAVKMFKEKWRLFMHGTSPEENGLSVEQTRDGLRNMSESDLRALARSQGITIPSGPIRPYGVNKLELTDAKDIIVYTIWTKLAETLA